MADREELEFTTSKRARWSSESSCDQSIIVIDSTDKEEANDDHLLRQTGSEQTLSFENISSETESREQQGVHVSHERLESDNFPTCFSVEDDLNNLDEHHFQPIAGPMGWIQRQMTLGINPEDVLAYMLPHAQLPPTLDKGTLWKIIIDILTEPTPRQKLDHINSLDDVVELLRGSKNIVVLTGAGVSVSCGIPDFRSRDGIYSKLSVEYPDLPDPQAMFDIGYFYQNPRPFFKFAKEIYPGQFKPSLGHRFIKQLESNGRLLKNYSQNIDTLEQIAGITRVIQCHGSFSTASCTNCKHRVSSEAIREDIFQQVIPPCPKCPQDGSCFAIMKPDIVFFGESLPTEFYHNLDEDSDKTDLLIVIGSSLKVRPVALIPSHIPPEVPQILINREPLRHMTFDVELLGDCDVIIAELCQRLGGAWNSLLEGYEIPGGDRRPLSSEDGNMTREEHQRVNCEERQDSEQMPQTVPTKGNGPSSHIKQLSEDATPASLLSTALEGHMTVGESSGSGDTCDDSYRDQPRASVSDQGNKLSLGNDTPHEGDPARFLFMPPSRYIFYGAEVMDSPLPSPSRNIPGFLDSTSEESDSDSVGEIDDNEASCGKLDDVIGDLMGQDCEKTDSCNQEGCKSSTNQTAVNGVGLGVNSSGSESNSDDGFDEGEGDVEKVLEPIINSEDTHQALSLILGGLSSYTCASEENSRLSGSDVPVTAGSSMVSDPSCLSSAAESLLADRPFSAVTMHTVLSRRNCVEPKIPERIGNASSKSGDDGVRSDAESDVTDNEGAEISSDSLQS